MNKAKKIIFMALAAALVLSFCTVAFAEGEEATHVSNFHATAWALLPPVVAIVLALITKEVYSSLFVGIVAGALMYSNFNFELAVNTMVKDGFIAKIADEWNVGILIFLVALGLIVVLINRAGGSAAYGRWATKRINTKRGAIFSTFFLGILIFIDDYFNCLTVGSVMRPITDKNNVSRAKLAYVIDATAAPVCMIAPISSWAAAVAGVVEGYNGIELFIRAIPYNLYSLLTLAMIAFMAWNKFDFGSMRKHEKNAEKGDLFTTESRPYEDAEKEEETISEKGKVIDLILPVLILIVSCIAGMVYTGGFFDGVSFIDAFAKCDASLGLAMGSLLALIAIMVYLVLRRAVTFKEAMDAVPQGFKAMGPAMLILIFAWTLSAMTNLLGADVFVSGIFESASMGLQYFLPVIVFIVAALLSFATGTSWGTFTILLPLVVACSETISHELLIIAISACLAGAVCGDHCSPISDTTIMSSTGAHCDHINHVSTQLPYALFVALVSAVGYVLAGFVQNAWIVLPVMLAAMCAVLFVIKLIVAKKDK
ncbi:MAG: Na+/H+ antiporter NhaC family protein [Clostridia bacterium]|nr:Na+/H+ antiporter NhaC family protein [Clostridia bacterium]